MHRQYHQKESFSQCREGATFKSSDWADSIILLNKYLLLINPENDKRCPKYHTIWRETASIPFKLIDDQHIIDLYAFNWRIHIQISNFIYLPKILVGEISVNFPFGIRSGNCGLSQNGHDLHKINLQPFA